MLVYEVMSAPAITVSADTLTRKALKMLDEYGITAMPVVDADGEIVGVVSEADLVRDEILPDPRAHMIPISITEWGPPQRVGSVMSTHVLTVSSSTDLVDAVDLMTSTVVKSLPVVDGGRVVGVISRKDVVHLLARRDDAIQAELQALVSNESVEWMVEVTDGIAHIAGPADHRERRIAEVLAGSVAGVVAVRVSPNPGDRHVASTSAALSNRYRG
jgi:CBS domain-containing protein